MSDVPDNKCPECKKTKNFYAKSGISQKEFVRLEIYLLIVKRQLRNILNVLNMLCIY